MLTRHPQTKVRIFEEMIPIDEKIANTIVYLNVIGYLTMFSCQGDAEQPFGYVSFDPSVNFTLVDRILVESLFGIAKPAIILPSNDEVREIPDVDPYWSMPWDARLFGGLLHGWSLHFRQI